MTGDHDSQSSGKRLIEDAIPISAINVVAQREKIGHAATHPRKLHLWWARRPLAAARAAVYATLIPAEDRGRTPQQEQEFFTALCQWGASDATIRRAREEILAANGGTPPTVLDMFAGGGAIPLEAARLGCDATAVELNPVAHIIERTMLEYPQKYAHLADDVRRWGNAWVERAWQQLADLYPPIHDDGDAGEDLFAAMSVGRRPLAYMWTRTVRCPNPALPQHKVDLVRQTWLSKKKSRMVALKPIVDRDALQVTYEVVHASSAEAMGFNPEAGSSRGQTSCRVCGATVTAGYVKAEGRAGRMGVAPLAAVVLNRSGRGRDYLAVGRYVLPDDDECAKRLAELPVTAPEERLVATYNQAIIVPMYGLTKFRDLFTPRQLLALCTLCAGVESTHDQMIRAGVPADRAGAIATVLGLALDRVVDRSSVLCRWDVKNESVTNTYARQALPMVWDFVETAPFGGAAGDVREMVSNVADIIDHLAVGRGSTCLRASATSLPLADESQDAVITDPPYYDNISYADLSDFFYVWLKRSIGFFHPDDFGGELTPKRSEAVSVLHRHGGNRTAATNAYESTMAAAFSEAHRVLKPGAPLVCIYAHKTTLGWATLVEALRTAGFTITEAWPLDTEMPERSRGQNSAALASSIFLVARKRKAGAEVGSEAAVMAELGGIITERLERLQQLGVSGSNLVIATVGAGLRALTRYERVEQDNGEQLPAERFLTLVQGKVLDAIFGSLSGADPVTRYYLAAQYSYGYVPVPFDEANNLARMTGVDLDSPQGLTSGRNPLVMKRGGTVELRDFEERGADPELGIPVEGNGRPSLVDVAHGLLWRAEHRPSSLRSYLLEAGPDAEWLRQVVQALAGKALRSATDATKSREAAAAERLLVSWRRFVEDSLFSGSSQ